MKQREGFVFDIQKYCIHDGPGIRTTIFLKGCPLRCLWCANPESQIKEPQYAFFENKCIGDGRCVKNCLSSALSFGENGLLRDDGKCIFCAKCVEDCFAGAIACYGKKMSVAQVVEECLKDLKFYIKSKGGVTLSGGEPFFQFDFAFDLLKVLKEKNINTAVETTGYTTKDKLQKVVPFIDVFLYDLKGINDEKHKKHTGVSNKIILSNLKYLSEIKKEVTIRVPIIPRYNNTKKDIDLLIAFIKDLPLQYEVNLLAYHRLGAFKYKALNKNYELEALKPPSSEDMEKIKQLFIKNNIKVQLGG